MSHDILILGGGFGGLEVAKIEANFLEENVPRVALSGPSLEWRPDEDDFETSRIERWFGT